MSDNLITILSGNIMFHVPESILKGEQRSELMQFVSKFADDVRASGQAQHSFVVYEDESLGFIAY